MATCQSRLRSDEIVALSNRTWSLAAKSRDQVVVPEDNDLATHTLTSFAKQMGNFGTLELYYYDDGAALISMSFEGLFLVSKLVTLF